MVEEQKNQFSLNVDSVGGPYSSQASSSNNTRMSKSPTSQNAFDSQGYGKNLESTPDGAPISSQMRNAKSQSDRISQFSSEKSHIERRIRTRYDNTSQSLNQDERAVFDLIRGCPEEQVEQELYEHLERNKGVFDITTLFEEDGYTALTFAISQNKFGACKALIEFINRRTEEIGNEISESSSAYSSQVKDAEAMQRRLELKMTKAMKKHFKCTLQQWINMNDRTDLRASALLLASFNGDIELIKLLVDNGADLRVATPSGVNALHMAA